MPFTVKQVKRIRAILPKNFRQKIVSKCKENGMELTVRQVSLILNDQLKNNDAILAVTQAISDLIAEEKAIKTQIQEKIKSEIL